jgi:phage-related protein
MGTAQSNNIGDSIVSEFNNIGDSLAPVGDTFTSVFQNTGSFITTFEKSLANSAAGISNVINSPDFEILLLLGGVGLVIYSIKSPARAY